MIAPFELGAFEVNYILYSFVFGRIAVAYRISPKHVGISQTRDLSHVWLWQVDSPTTEHQGKPRNTENPHCMMGIFVCLFDKLEISYSVPNMLDLCYVAVNSKEQGGTKTLNLVWILRRITPYVELFMRMLTAEAF